MQKGGNRGGSGQGRGEAPGEAGEGGSGEVAGVILRFYIPDVFHFHQNAK